MDIRNKLHRTINPESPGEKIKTRIWILSYLILAACSITAYLLLKLHIFKVFGTYQGLLQKLALGVFIATLILAIVKWMERNVIVRTKAVYTRYNVTKMIRLLSWLLIF